MQEIKSPVCVQSTLKRNYPCKFEINGNTQRYEEEALEGTAKSSSWSTTTCVVKQTYQTNLIVTSLLYYPRLLADRRTNEDTYAHEICKCDETSMRHRVNRSPWTHPRMRDPDKTQTSWKASEVPSNQEDLLSFNLEFKLVEVLKFKIDAIKFNRISPP